MREFTVRAVVVGTLLGMVFGASSLYLVLKVGLTVSASIPVAVISLTLFRLWSKVGGRDATILENNIVQTAGSAGESIAFGLGVTMPAIMILGFDLEITPGDAGWLAGRLAGHPDDDSAAPRVDRRPARATEVSGRHGLRRGAQGRGFRGIPAGHHLGRPAPSCPESEPRPSPRGSLPRGSSAATIFTGFGIGSGSTRR